MIKNWQCIAHIENSMESRLLVIMPIGVNNMTFENLLHLAVERCYLTTEWCSLQVVYVNLKVSANIFISTQI